jgi:hypothetical protein
MKPHKTTYTVTVKIEDNFQSRGPCYVARDASGTWRTYAKIKDITSELSPDQLVGGWMFHADEVESVSVIDDVITAVIREW